MNIEMMLDELKGLDKVVKLTLSDKGKTADAATAEKVTMRPVQMKGRLLWQMESRRGTQVFHENLTTEQASARFAELAPLYRQICAVKPGESCTYTHYGKKMKKSVSGNDIVRAAAQDHNRGKSYLLPEGEAVPALVDLGVFTQQYTIVHSRYDKYKQINRFLELIDDSLRSFPRKRIRIMDFGCGKSYLTFILYYYLTEKRGLDAEIIGYDLKADVVENCNAIAARYGYDKLRFILGDVSRDTVDAEVDMLVTLHACDTATDYALDYAIRNRVPYVFSVPCCQHEVNLSVHKGGDLDIFMKHGLLKERMSALLTDAIRSEVMERCGYEVDVIEFVDLTHTPKNLMLRCRLLRSSAAADLGALKALQQRYGFQQTLLRLTDEYWSGKPRVAKPSK
ncbi:MAG: SAM-dependent methyltransferase [Ruminococcaceae bacterium]|nr:SAM-dependent methyltransferase [Oscillospiraceae bacterium]